MRTILEQDPTPFSQDRRKGQHILDFEFREPLLRISLHPQSMVCFAQCMILRRPSNLTLNTQDIFSSSNSEEPHFSPIHTPAITENPILHVALDSPTHNRDDVVCILAGCFVIKDSSTHEFIQGVRLNVSSNRTASMDLHFDFHHAIYVVSVLVDYSILGDGGIGRYFEARAFSPIGDESTAGATCIHGIAGGVHVLTKTLYRVGGAGKIWLAPT
mmetsp:Transcript_1475/g.2525  ORF Transcript_1475/g.2525 Transcript_1475/m.2525 type:complete len:215 (+) Transcript_1475:1744-2388(+)